MCSYYALASDSEESEEFVIDEFASEEFVSEDFMSEELVSDEFVQSSKSLSDEFVEAFIAFDSFLYGNTAKVGSREVKSKTKNCKRYIFELGFPYTTVTGRQGKKQGRGERRTPLVTTAYHCDICNFDEADYVVVA